MTRYIVIVALLLSIFLGACVPGRVDNKNVVSALDADGIVDQFRYDEPALLAVSAEILRAPNDPKYNSLYHTDPLQLTSALVRIVGSDTLSSITQAVIDDFHTDGFIGQFQMNQSSTGAGMNSMCRNQGIDIVNASRDITPDEKLICEQHEIVPVSIKIGHDPFSLITHKLNFWVKGIQRDELELLFRARYWSDLNPNYPRKEVSFYLPRKAGGAMVALSEFVYGDADSPFIRNVSKGRFYPYNLELTRDLAEDIYGVGFGSYGKLIKLKQLNANFVPIDGAQPVISGRRYPISRSMYLVTNVASLEKPEVQTFIAHYLNRARDLMPALGFSPLDGDEVVAEQLKLLANVRTTQLANDNVHVSLFPP